MPQLSITQLPPAGTLTGSEPIPIVQNGVTVQTTTGAIAGAGALNYPFVTFGSTTGLAQARQLTSATGISLVDGGVGGSLQVTLTGAASSLNSSGTGIQVKTASNTVTARTLAVGSGLTIANGDGVSGDPTVGLNTFLSNFASLTGTGMLAIQSGTVAKVNILGTTSQTSIANGDGSGDITVALASNPVLPGAAGTVLPTGGTAARASSPTNGTMRYNSDSAVFEGYANNAWGAIATGAGVVSIDTGTGLTGGPITSTGTISIANTAVTAGSYGSATQVGTFTVNGQGQLTAAGNTTVTPAWGSITSTPTTIAGYGITDGVTLTGAETLTNKTISGSSNTLTNIANASLTNSSVTVGTTNVALGATSLTLGGLTSVTVTQDPTAALQLATKQYVDTIAVTSVHYHSPVFVESPNTTGNLNATYNQPGGAGDGVGATLTNAGTQVALTIDGVLMTTGKRVLIYNQTSGFQNGVYTVTTVGDASTNWVMTRATDADTYDPISSTGLGGGDAFFVTNGDTGAGETYVCSNQGVIVFGTTDITFVQISSTQVYSAGNGLTLTGTQFSLTAPVTAANGGSGQTSYATGDTLYASNSTTLSKLTVGTANQIMVSSGTAPQWSSTLTGATLTSAVLGSNLDTNGYSIVGGNFGGNQLVLPVGFGPTLQGLYEGNAFIKTGTTGAANRTWTYLDSDGSFTSPGPVVAIGGIAGGAF